MSQAVILAGGKGTRLRERLGDLPKPMIPFGGRPLLEHLLELCARHGLEDVVLLVGCGAGAIREHVGDGARWGVRVRYQAEDRPLGTAGAVMAMLPVLAERFVVLYGDTMVNVDLRRLWEAHASMGAAGTLLVHPNDHPLDSDLVELDDANRVIAFRNRPHLPDRWYPNLVNAGLYVLEQGALVEWRSRCAGGDFGRDLLPAMLGEGAWLQGYRSGEYIKDVGTPARYDRICAEWDSGVVARGSRSTPQPAVFLDRDGVLNEETGGVCTPEQLTLIPGSAEAVSELNHLGLRAVLVTNQPVVAKGFCTPAALREIHHKLETLLGRERAFLDRIFVCPHHPERGFAGEVPSLKIDCACRKPKPGLLLEAARELNLDLACSWLVGDSTADLAAAKAAGVRSILVQTGHAGKDGKYSVTPDIVCANLQAAVGIIRDTLGPRS